MRDPLAALDMCVNTHSPDPDDISYAILRHIGEQSKAFCCLYLIAFGGRVLFSKLKRWQPCFILKTWSRLFSSRQFSPNPSDFLHLQVRKDGEHLLSLLPLSKAATCIHSVTCHSHASGWGLFQKDPLRRKGGGSVTDELQPWPSLPMPRIAEMAPSHFRIDHTRLTHRLRKSLVIPYTLRLLLLVLA